MSSNPAGRPRKYKDDAQRQAAYRERWEVRSFRMTPGADGTAATIARLATEWDESESTVLHALITFALLNRNWHTLDLKSVGIKRLGAGGGNQGKRRASKILQKYTESDDAQ